ncbi:hypothetical protein H105_07811 [Trichophyton soudanense CBS 452.61]|uniref:Uncharacterized protein n=1 Tax=Trichophyton soudanense CBS 452.61 TaxID=1215331 RepID=A0A022XH65_TRISD|nr:hypothetical protein H100_07824 [Trichophyton rubrum MR850]EZF37956.1 hypothetical protein H102_07787 [Trichophyton rubrum CBS 100081]EZF69819.1 hypothetical protein H105_07811 [Trichophyton soudanense CBS 452.61]
MGRSSRRIQCPYVFFVTTIFLRDSDTCGEVTASCYPWPRKPENVSKIVDGSKYGTKGNTKMSEEHSHRDGWRQCWWAQGQIVRDCVGAGNGRDELGPKPVT